MADQNGTITARSAHDALTPGLTPAICCRSLVRAGRETLRADETAVTERRALRARLLVLPQRWVRYLARTSACRSTLWPQDTGLLTKRWRTNRSCAAITSPCRHLTSSHCRFAGSSSRTWRKSCLPCPECLGEWCRSMASNHSPLTNTRLLMQRGLDGISPNVD